MNYLGVSASPTELVQHHASCFYRFQQSLRGPPTQTDTLQFVHLKHKAWPGLSHPRRLLQQHEPFVTFQKKLLPTSFATGLVAGNKPLFLFLRTEPKSCRGKDSLELLEDKPALVCEASFFFSFAYMSFCTLLDMMPPQPTKNIDEHLASMS